MPLLGRVTLTWSSKRSNILLVALTLICLIPFSGKAFHIDDPLFIWSAEHILKHPLNPYGFNVVWSSTEMPMSQVNKNPPIAAYFIAAIGIIAGWTERVLHIAFLLPALAVILGTYRLALRFSRSPLLAAVATLFAPGFLVSASGVMCDTLMLAFWILALTFWIEGLEKKRSLYLLAAAILIAVAALTKYFGAALIPLVLLYSHSRQRRFGNWIWFLCIPIAVLFGYQVWTQWIYGRGLLFDAAAYAGSTHGRETFGKVLVGIGFAGGCMLSGLTFSPLFWSRRKISLGLAAAALAGAAIGAGWIDCGTAIPQRCWVQISGQLVLCIAAGIAILSLTVADLCKRKDPDSLFLTVWIFGTLYFAGFLNWTINARSILPLIPAVSIILARRIDSLMSQCSHLPRVKLIIPLILTGAISMLLAWADTDLANAGRRAATLVHNKVGSQPGETWFQGHWGFQYYMQRIGAQAADAKHPRTKPGDVEIIPENNTDTFDLDLGSISSYGIIQVETHQWLTTMHSSLGAGFYSYVWGPLPFAFGRVPPERYHLYQFSESKQTPGTKQSVPAN